jgi:hypothetical protein
MKNLLFIRGNWRDQTAGRLTIAYWMVWLHVWHPWLILKTSLIRIWYRWMPLLFALAVPNQFKYPVWGQEPGCLTHTYRRLLTEERLFSPAYYYTVGTSGNAVQCHTISAVLWFDYLQTSLNISIHLHFAFITWVEFAYEASWFYYKLWEKLDITREPVITYIYCVVKVMRPVYIFFFKRSFGNRARSELKCKRGMKEPTNHWHCAIYRKLLPNPF